MVDVVLGHIMVIKQRHIKGSVNDIVIFVAVLVVWIWHERSDFAGLAAKPDTPGCPCPNARRSRPGASSFRLAARSPTPPSRYPLCAFASASPHSNPIV